MPNIDFENLVPIENETTVSKTKFDISTAKPITEVNIVKNTEPHIVTFLKAGGIVTLQLITATIFLMIIKLLYPKIKNLFLKLKEWLLSGNKVLKILKSLTLLANFTIVGFLLYGLATQSIDKSWSNYYVRWNCVLPLLASSILVTSNIFFVMKSPAVKMGFKKPMFLELFLNFLERKNIEEKIKIKELKDKLK